jgi:hypothetical protein
VVFNTYYDNVDVFTALQYFKGPRKTFQFAFYGKLPMTFPMAFPMAFPIKAFTMKITYIFPIVFPTTFPSSEFSHLNMCF